MTGGLEQGGEPGVAGGWARSRAGRGGCGWQRRQLASLEPAPALQFCLQPTCHPITRPAHSGSLPPAPCPPPLQLKEEEEKKMAEVKVVDGVKRVVDKLLGRRKQKRGYEYEVQWKNEAETSWLSRDRLEEMGFSKMLMDIDMKVGAGAGVVGVGVVRARGPAVTRAGSLVWWLGGAMRRERGAGVQTARDVDNVQRQTQHSGLTLPPVPPPSRACLPAGGCRRRPAGQAPDRQERGGDAGQPGPARRVCHPLPDPRPVGCAGDRRSQRFWGWQHANLPR